MNTGQKNHRPVLNSHNLYRLENFGHSIYAPVYLQRPVHTGQIEDLMHAARKEGFSIGLRGAGRSYGDAAINSGQVVLDLRRMNRILAWDPEKGIITVEPGVTIEQLWRYVLDDGWWLPVSPGTMRPTLGGCLGANVHGKNNWVAGTLGEHVQEFDALLANGKSVTCSPKKNTDLFYAMISGMGMLGVMTSITLKMKKVYSGNLEVLGWAEPNLERVLQAIDDNKEEDYIVGWVDSTARGRALGRGQMHKARYLQPGEDANPAVSMNVDNQDLPDNILGLVPKSMVWRFLRYGMNNWGARAGNSAKYFASRRLGHMKQHRQSLVEFTYLLDYVPNWERAYGKRGLIQYQSFLPKETAYDVFRDILKLSQRRHMPAYLGVVKRHRPDPFLFSHAVDGFSLALDFKVSNPKNLGELTRELNQIVLQGNGRFYFAKDSTLTADVVRSYLGEESIKKFKALKKKYDPDEILQTDLYRRCFTEG